MMRFLVRAAILVALLVGATACSKSGPKMPAPTPALAVPAPPPRVLVPVTIPEPEPLPPAPAVPSTQPGRPPSTTSTRPPDRVTPPTQTPVPTPEVTPTPVLQTTTNATEVEKDTRALLRTAKTALDRVDVSALKPDAKASYDTARSYLRRADDALKVKNVEYAKELAEKAAALGALLVKR